MKRSQILTTRKNRKSPEIPKLYPSIVSKTGPDSSGWKNSLIHEQAQIALNRVALM